MVDPEATALLRQALGLERGQASFPRQEKLLDGLLKRTSRELTYRHARDWLKTAVVNISLAGGLQVRGLLYYLARKVPHNLTSSRTGAKLRSGCA